MRTLFCSDSMAIAAPIFRVWHGLGHVVPGEALDRWSDAVIVRLKKDPPREEPESGRFVIVAQGEGEGRRVKVTLTGTSPYVLTGFLCASTAEMLLNGEALHAGYVSLAQAFGARALLRRLEEIGTRMTCETMEVPRVAA